MQFHIIMVLAFMLGVEKVFAGPIIIEGRQVWPMRVRVWPMGVRAADTRVAILGHRTPQPLGQCIDKVSSSQEESPDAEGDGSQQDPMIST